MSKSYKKPGYTLELSIICVTSSVGRAYGLHSISVGSGLTSTGCYEPFNRRVTGSNPV